MQQFDQDTFQLGHSELSKKRKPPEPIPDLSIQDDIFFHGHLMHVMPLFCACLVVCVFVQVP